MNTRIEDQVYAKRQFIQFLTQIHPEDLVAVYALGSRLQILQDFTGDSRALLRSLARYRGQSDSLVAESEPDPANTGDTEMDKWLNTVQRLDQASRGGSQALPILSMAPAGINAMQVTADSTGGRAF